ncbi:hypothetical protein CsSME_00045583 [Camellia sinensis var. sinensis]
MVLMNMIHLQVKAAQRLDVNTGLRFPKGAGLAPKDPILQYMTFDSSGNFHFCKDDIDVETIFRSSFGGNRHFYWSFVDEDFSRWRSSSGYSNNYRTSWNWRHGDEEDYDSTESDSSESDLASDRLALGLSAYGPLKLEDVKNAYRVCALKWHPDRHQGSSKAVAEEKFKACSSAYQSLCDKLLVILNPNPN